MPKRRAACARVFDSVADKYDIMNDLMSAGVHRLWKRYTLGQTGLRPGQRALDVAGGTGDIAAGMARQVQEAGLVVLSDINEAMLRRRSRPAARPGPAAQRALCALPMPNACRSRTNRSTA